MTDQENPRFPELQILSPQDQDEILSFSRARADAKDPFVEWSAPWRKESLEHYLRLGWSMARRDASSGKLLGYVLAQPFLFFRGHTQTVWIEHFEAETPSLAAELVDTMVRISREKHMQRVLMDFDPAKSDPSLGDVIRARNGRMIEKDILEFATTKTST